MARSTYAPIQKYTGNGALAAYTFDFKIEALTQLLIIELDDTGVETHRVRGNDTTYLSTVTPVAFDGINGGGTVTLLAVLPSNYTLVLLLANDEPTQPYEFRNKGSFTLKTIETALDFIAGAIQRLAFRAAQSLRIHENDDSTTFSPQFPPGIANQGGRFIIINAGGTAFEYSLTIPELKLAVMPTPTVTGQIVRWNGTTWEAALYGGGLGITGTQNIAAGGVIGLNLNIQQLLKVQGNGAARTASTTPFGSVIPNGAIITLVGQSDTNTLKIPYSDSDYGCLLKGDRYLGLNDTLTLVYNLTDKRLYEISRN